jgi:hypothetical protein
MEGLLLALFRFLIQIIPNLIYDLGKYFLVKKFLNPKSRLYYKALIERLKMLYYNVKIILLLVILTVIIRLSIGRPLSKDLQTKVVIVFVLLFLAIAYFVIEGAKNKKIKEH